MSATYPPLPPELIAFAHGGVSILVGTCGADLAPDCVRGMGVKVWPGACRATVLLPARTAAVSMENLRTNPRIAVTLSHIPTLRTLQLKGAVIAMREGDEAARELALRYRELLAGDLAFVGQPGANTLRLGLWPLHAVDLEIGVVFAQTPGPSAGARMPLPAGGS